MHAHTQTCSWTTKTSGGSSKTEEMKCLHISTTWVQLEMEWPLSVILLSPANIFVNLFHLLLQFKTPSTQISITISQSYCQKHCINIEDSICAMLDYLYSQRWLTHMPAPFPAHFPFSECIKAALEKCWLFICNNHRTGCNVCALINNHYHNFSPVPNLVPAQACLIYSEELRQTCSGDW